LRWSKYAIEALRDAGGASTNYQKTIKQLVSLERILADVTQVADIKNDIALAAIVKDVKA
jgi:hypothetical protein